MSKAWPTLALALIGASVSVSQPLPLTVPFEAPQLGPMDAAVPAPQAILGHVIGSRHSRYEQVRDYFRAVDAASDRVVVRNYGLSHDGRQLVYAVVSSPENLARLEEIRQANLRLSENPGSVPDAELAKMPTVLWMGYGVHGNEASTPEAAILFLYGIAAGQHPALVEKLRNVVVIVDPLYNPDGHDRHVNWLNLNRGFTPTDDANHREHNEPWPGGRTNKYFFDLNRDWLPAQNPESQARLAVYHSWRPQILADYHEMGGENTYYFHPGIPTRNNPATPAVLNDLTDRASRFLAGSLDRIGSLYYTREQFDDFYYGKGSSYPDINGAVGILFEQGSSRALLRQTQNGLLTFGATIRNQVATSFGMLDAAAALRPELLRAQRDIYASVDGFVDASKEKGWVVCLREHTGRALAFAETLARHGVRIEQLQEDLTVGGRTYKAREAYLLPLRQPQARLLHSSMERRTSFPDTGFYDVSAWTLPLAFDVAYAELDREVRGPAWTPARPRLEPVGTAAFAYAFPWGDLETPARVGDLLEAGFQLRLMNRPLKVGDRTLPAGHIIVPVTQPTVPAARVHEEMRKMPVEVIPIQSGLTNLGTAGGDLGTPSAEVLRLPRVAVLSGPTTSANAVGEAWHALSVRFGLATTLLDVERLATADLSRYTAIVVTGSLPEAATAALRAWVQAGGVLVATGSGAEWTVTAGFLNLRPRPAPSDADLAKMPFGELAEARRSRMIPGTILAAKLDTTHPLTLGLDADLPVLRRGATLYDGSPTPGVVFARYTESPLLAGYLPEAQKARVSGAVAGAAVRLGRGSVVAIMDNPNFRGFWLGGTALFANAVFFGNGF